MHIKKYEITINKRSILKNKNADRDQQAYR